MSLKSKIFLESFQGTSQLSVDSFMDLWDRLVAQKLEIQIFLCQKVINPGGPPLVTYLRDIGFIRGYSDGEIWSET